MRGFDPTGAPMSAGEAVRGFLDALGVPPERVPATLDAQVGLYRGLLADRRVLVVLDNVRGAEQVRPLLPGAAGCATVVVSRNQLSGLVVAEGARPLRLDLLTEAESRELIARRVGAARVAEEVAAVRRIVASCGGLPLALAIVAARAATHPEFTLDALAGELRAARGLDAFAAGDTAADVRAVFSWSYRSLSPPAARLFRLLAAHPGPEVTVATAASLAGRPPDQVRSELRELARPTWSWSRPPAGTRCTTCSARTRMSWAATTASGRRRCGGCWTTTCARRSPPTRCSGRTATPWRHLTRPTA
ncbi:NB-ARC domain-containing protein [Micromonospora sp. 4G55]|uniref:NB-ARC domain-containing protein n=1 Tax=Micromonospora sp. 4G55 TaxID=2806102 RepID=UPI00278C6CB0|nr:NB-ARC domain-containing protein [Micromonospora sp. 4G55]